jgi:CRP-like cAMP-binding protein
VQTHSIPAAHVKAESGRRAKGRLKSSVNSVDDNDMDSGAKRTDPSRNRSKAMKRTTADYIVDGSIIIDSIEAFGKILKDFPGRPELMRMHADRLAAGRLKAAAVRQYHEAASLFLNSGRLLQAWVAKILQWQLQRPTRDQLVEFHRAIESTPHNGAPADDFIQNLDPLERMAVFSHSRRTGAPAGTDILFAEKRPADLYLVVSGRLRESCYEMISQKNTFRRETCRVLGESDSFGEIYPFSEENPAQPHVVTSTRAELLVISRRRLIRTCRKYPNVESGVIRLCRSRSKRKAEAGSNGVRKGLRYTIPTRMSIEIFPVEKNESPIILTGYCRDLSVSGVSFLPERNGADSTLKAPVGMDSLISRRVRVTIPAEELSISISGQIVRKRSVVVKGIAMQSLGIQFAKMPPRLRGAFFAFADSAKNI